MPRNLLPKVIPYIKIGRALRFRQIDVGNASQRMISRHEPQP
jgi:hypothetical protein